MLLEDAVILIVGSTIGLDFIFLQFVSSHCRVYVYGRPNESASFQRAKSRIRDINLVYLADNDESSNCGSDKDNAHIEDVMQKLLCRESRLDLVIFSSADNEEQTIRFVLPTLISTSKQCGRSNIILIKAASRRPRTRMDSLKRVQSRPLGYEEGREYEDNQAEVVKAKLTILLEGHHAENVFVNTTNPDLLLTLIMEHDGCRQHKLPNHNSTTVVPTSSAPFATRASSS
ncbi:hypothetical protein V1508DRAFT_262594 [Lipomyces doorenjongii]|uniref:uncharacterized protein n=1 Tax=Lipomyces doorenjongii TaxID=383834 RepID=UPI0034CFD851